MIELTGCNKVIGGKRYPAWVDPCDPDYWLEGCYREVLGHLAPVLKEPIGMCEGERVGCHRVIGGKLAPVLQLPEYETLQDLIDNCCEESSSSSSSSSESSSSSSSWPPGKECGECPEGQTPKYIRLTLSNGKNDWDGSCCVPSQGYYYEFYDVPESIDGTYILEQNPDVLTGSYKECYWEFFSTIAPSSFSMFNRVSSEQCEWIRYGFPRSLGFYHFRVYIYSGKLTIEIRIEDDAGFVPGPEPTFYASISLTQIDGCVDVSDAENELAQGECTFRNPNAKVTVEPLL